MWSLTLPAGAIEHGSRVKIRMKKGDGEWVDRVPAWIKMSYSEPGVMGAGYDGIYWDPPAGEKYTRSNPRPERPAASRIYEAHVGMSGLEAKVNSYREFADDILPRIKELRYNTVQLMAVQEHAYYGSVRVPRDDPFRGACALRQPRRSEVPGGQGARHGHPRAARRDPFARLVQH